MFQSPKTADYRDAAEVRANKLAKQLEAEKAKSEQLVKKLNNANQSVENELKMLRGFITLKGYVAQYQEFLRELARNSLASENQAQSAAPRQETRQRTRMR